MRSVSQHISRFQWRRAFLLGGAALLTLGLAAGLLAALEALAVTRPSVAWANGGSSGAFTDTTSAEFGAACAVLTNATVSPASGGEVRLAATLEDYFDGASLNTSLWITGTATDFYTVPITVTGGAVTLNSNFLRAQANFQTVQPRFYEARVQQAVNTAAPGNTVVGFAREDTPGSPITDTSASRIFIGPSTADMYARWRDGLAGGDLTVSPNPDLTQYHLFRIEWESGETRWYIDDVLTATLTEGVTTLNTWVWLYAQDPDTEMNVDWIRAGQYAASGSYLSCARDAGGVVNWSTLTATASTPAGAGLALRTRTSLDGVNWSAWSAPLTSTLVTSPSGRYFQYLAEMTSATGVRSPELQQVRVDYFGPTTAQVSPSPATLDPGEVRQFSAQGYDANGRPVDSLNFSWGVVNGGGSINSSGLFTAVLTPGTYLNTISATVPTTGGPVTGFSTVTVRDLAPTANAGGPYTVSEGVTATLAGSGADPNGLAVTLDWDLDNDGSFETANQSSPAFYRGDNGLFTVRLRVTENGGAGLTTTVTSPVTVTNAAPTATFTVTPTILPEGSAFDLLLTDPFDLGEADRVVGFTYSFDCGGGGYGSFGLNNTANCATNDNAARTVRGRIQDKDGGITEYTRTVTVTNVTPAVSILGAPANSPEGTEITLTSVITDPGMADTHTYVWSVTKDGVPYTSGTAAALSFTPNDNGAYLVTLTATDDDGASGEDSRLITVTNVAPAATFTASPTSVPEGSAFDLSLTSPSDASSVDNAVGFTYAFSCAGGAFGSYSGISATACSTTDNGVRTVGGRIRDKDGGVMEYTRTVTVTNVAPTVSITGAPAGSVAEGTAVTLGQTLTDPGTADTHTYAWSVTKNGNAYASGAGTGFTFTPDDNGTYVVTLTATDDDGGQGTDEVTITVTNAAPAVAIKDAPASSPVGREVTLTNTVTDPGTADTFAYAWSVTKNGSPYASGTTAAFSFTPDETGSYVVTLVVTDDDGGSGSHNVTIASLYQVSLPLVMRSP